VGSSGPVARGGEEADMGARRIFSRGVQKPEASQEGLKGLVSMFGTPKPAAVVLHSVEGVWRCLCVILCAWI